MAVHPEDLTTEQRIALLTQKYSSESDVYERLWAPGLRRMGVELLERLEPAGVRAALDVGAGVGALLDDVAQHAPEALIVGSDRALGMLQLASRRHALTVADATRLPFRDRSFDLITMTFVLFHLPHPVDGLQEATRVLVPGGRVATATWGDEETWPVLDAWHDELDRYGVDAPGGLHSLHELVDTPEKVAMHMRDSRLGDVQTWTSTLERTWDVETFIEFVTGMATAKRRFDMLAQRDRRRFLETATSRIRELPAAAFISRTEVVFGVGTR